MDKKDTSFASFLAITILVGVALCSVVFFFVFKYFKGEKMQLNLEDVNLGEATEATKLGVIVELSFNQNSLSIFDIEEKAEMEEMTLLGSTKYVDMDDMIMAKQEVYIGDIVYVTYNEENKAVNLIKQNRDALKIQDIEKFSVDYLNKKVTVGKDVYKMEETLVLHYKNETVPLSEVLDRAIVSMKGYGDTIYSISIQEYMGGIRFIYPDYLQGAEVEIDGKGAFPIQEIDKVALKAGEYKLLVKKLDIESIPLTVTVKEREIEEIDLSNVNLKTALVTLKVNIGDYYVHISREDKIINHTYTDNLNDITDVEKIYNNQVELPLGNYTLNFTKKGFKDKSIRITVERNMTVSVPLESDGTTFKTTIESTPANAEVYINGNYLGDSPVTTYLFKGTNAITIKKSGYADFTQTVETTKSENYHFQLQTDNPYPEAENE